MAHFVYTARNQSGQILQASLDAPSRRDAMRVLNARGLQIIDLNEASAGQRPVEAAAAPAANVTFSTRERLPFLQALVELIGSGMPAGEAVRLLSVRIKAPHLRAVCGKLWERLGEGLPLSRALATLPEVFDGQTVSLIAAGEATGNLKEVLLRLIQHFTDQKELRQKIVTALAYPVFICFVAVGVVLFFIFFLMPRLQTLLSSLGGSLPWSTQLLVGFSHFALRYGLLLIVAGIGGFVAFLRWRRTEAGQAASDAWLLRVPVAGRFITSTTVLNFSQTLAVLLENGVTTAEALRMTERTITHHTLRQAFGQATDRVLEGEKLSQSLARTQCFPDLVLDRLAVGESTGNLAPSLREIARTYQGELARQLQGFTTLASSVVLLFAFSFVAFIAYAIVSAVFSVSTNFKF